MLSGKITQKGQVTVPKAVREHMGVGENDRVCFTPLEDGRVMLAACNRDISVLYGLLDSRPSKRKHLSLEEIEEVINEQRLKHGLGVKNDFD